MSLASMVSKSVQKNVAQIKKNLLPKVKEAGPPKTPDVVPEMKIEPLRTAPTSAGAITTAQTPGGMQPSQPKPQISLKTTPETTARRKQLRKPIRL